MINQTIKLEMQPSGKVVLLEEFQIKLTNFYGEGKSLVVTIPAGYKSDMASVPWFGRFLWPYASAITIPSIVHDFLCDENKRDKSVISRKDADKAFLILLKENEVRCPWSLWLAVRAFAIFTGRK